MNLSYSYRRKSRLWGLILQSNILSLQANIEISAERAVSQSSIPVPGQLSDVEAQQYCEIRSKFRATRISQRAFLYAPDC